MADQVFGIDLGTTYSAIAYINDYGQPEVIRNGRDEGDTTPSVVFFENETNFVVGKEAKNGARINPDTTVALIKRQMGTKFRLEFFGEIYGPEKISSLILQELISYGKEGSGIETDKVVITVPAYFGVAEKEATRQAGDLAGLDVVGIVTEPVAAALSVGITGEETKTIFVYDLGGGTFDCTVIQLSPGVVEVLAIDGDRVLGGADWDARLFELINSKFMAQAGLHDDPTADGSFAQKLMSEVEDTKRTLSRRERASVRLSFGDANEQIEVTRVEFEVATRDLVDKTLEIARRTLETAQKKRPGIAIDEFLLVGGSSKMPMIPASLEKEMGWTLRRTDLDLAVAKGAAVYGNGVIKFDEDVAVRGSSTAPTGDGNESAVDDAKRLLIGGTAVEVRNALSRSLGVQFARESSGSPGTLEHYVGFIAHANDALPDSWTVNAAIISDGATELAIEIFEQGSAKESESLSSNRRVTPPDAVLRNLPYLPAGSPIQLELHIDAEGKATLSAFEPSTAQRLQLEVSLAVMQKDEVEAAKRQIARMVRRD